MTRVCLYTRISTDEENQPTSLHSQRERLEAFCERLRKPGPVERRSSDLPRGRRSAPARLAERGLPRPRALARRQHARPA
jgi:hypothetical protein